MKKCTKCGVEKSLDNFYHHPKIKDGKDTKCIKCVKLYKQQNKDFLYINQKILNNTFKNNNPQYFKKYNISYQKTRRSIDPIFKLKGSIRNLIKDSFLRQNKKGWIKSKHSEEVLGCTLEYFIQHLQSQFTEGMTLENYGKWEIDHIIPLASAKTEENVYKLNHYTNLQPLWKEDNRSKGKNIL